MAQSEGKVTITTTTTTPTTTTTTKEDEVTKTSSSSSSSSPPPSSISSSTLLLPPPPPPQQQQSSKYHALIIDSGAIIKHTGYSTLFNAASNYYTVPGVLSEIRDAKARQHLDALPFELQTRMPSAEATKKVVDFARLTGDYVSLSSVDLQVLGLVYDLEMEGCKGNMKHIRTKPKHKLGLGKIQHLKNPNDDDNNDNNNKKTLEETTKEGGGKEKEEKGEGKENVNASFFEMPSTAPTAAAASAAVTAEEKEEEEEGKNAKKTRPKSWAALVNPAQASTTTTNTITTTPCSLTSPSNNTQSQPVVINFNDIQAQQQYEEEEHLGGQFSDAESSSSSLSSSEEGEELGMAIANQVIQDTTTDGFSDEEECDVYILDPEEVEARKQQQQQQGEKKKESAMYETLNNYPTTTGTTTTTTTTTMAEEEEEEEQLKDDLNSDFPSLAAASTVPYEGSSSDNDDDDNNDVEENPNAPPPPSKEDKLEKHLKEEEERKQKALQPKKGKHYNSFRKYGHVVSKEGVASAREEKKLREAEMMMKKKKEEEEKKEEDKKKDDSSHFFGENDGGGGDDGGGVEEKEEKKKKQHQSRIIGGLTMSGQGTEVEDDGEGWITCSKDIRSMKATSGGSKLDPTRTPSNHHHHHNNNNNTPPTGPPTCQRAACATTDFAMQNVLLQMNLELLTIDGTKVKKLKSWVIRCGACYAVYANGEKDGVLGGGGAGGRKSTTNRLFCDRCGSDFLQRVAASVDKKSGRLRLHLKKNYRHNIRGTKFSLPKPGTGNRFEGDLLLREDQLMMGAWNQKVKKSSGKKAAQSMFGSDLADNVGCHADLRQRSDIKVGFGRKNPNSSKFGRERRGKKKKSTDKACGVRRY